MRGDEGEREGERGREREREREREGRSDKGMAELIQTEEPPNPKIIGSCFIFMVWGWRRLV